MTKKRVLLIGGGHGNLQVLHGFAKEDQELFDLTVISDVQKVPYSGMIPSYMAGIYKQNDLLFDLPDLCRRFQFHFIHSSVKTLNAQEHFVELANGEKVDFNYGILNIGSITNVIPTSEQALTQVIYAKPMSEFLEIWEQRKGQIKSVAHADLNIVGGGAGAFELAIACRRSFPERTIRVRLISGEGGLLPENSDQTRILAKQSLLRLGLELIQGRPVNRIEKDKLVLSDDSVVSNDLCLIAVTSRASDVLKNSGLPIDASGTAF